MKSEIRIFNPGDSLIGWTPKERKNSTTYPWNTTPVGGFFIKIITAEQFAEALGRPSAPPNCGKWKITLQQNKAAKEFSYLCKRTA